MNEYRTDKNNNPTAFTTDLAEEGGLIKGIDYEEGDAFGNLHTAKIIGDPVSVTIKLIDKIGFFTNAAVQRWKYIAIPYKIWSSLSYVEKLYVISWMYQHEGGEAMKCLSICTTQK